MSRRRRGRRVSGTAAPGGSSAAAPRDFSASVATWALVLAFACSALAVDSGTEASFDAPKRLGCLLAIALAAAALSFSPWRRPFLGPSASSLRRVSALLISGALVWALVSAIASPHRSTAIDAVRVVGLYLLLLPIGASRVMDRRKGLLLATFLAVLAVNAAVSILQALGLYQPFALVAHGEREATGAYVGNVGNLALSLALAAVAAFGVLLGARRPAVKAAGGAAALLFVAGLLVNQNLTSLSALMIGGIILSVALFGRRAVLGIASIGIVLALGITVYRPMRRRVEATLSAARAGDWNRMVTYRVGAWKAAIGMARERPLLGYGPGTFATEFVPHRLAAEIEARKSYENPLRTNSYAEAHCDYLQAFAEFGFPAGLAALGAVVLILPGLARAARHGPPDVRREACLLLAILGAGAAAALTWFPMQRPVCAVPVLLALGRAWRISGTTPEGEP